MISIISGLKVDLYQLTMGQCYFFDRPGVWATFEVFIRQKRKNRPFYIACGIQKTLETIANFKFSQQDINYLKNLGIFRRDFLHYLKRFKFTGYIWSVDEGEIIFPEEPIFRVIAPIIEGQIVESMVLNTINLYTTLATKSARVVLVSGSKNIFDFSLRRTQGIEASLAAAYTSYLCGVKATSNVLAGKLYGIPVIGTMAHSFVQSYPDEYKSFLSFARNFPKNTLLLIDTFDIPEGLNNTLKIARFLKREGYHLLGVRIDSGNLAEEARKARRFLDRKGAKDVKVILSGNLDEYKIKEIVRKKVPVDGFGVGTLMGTSADLPYTDVIYKLTEVSSSQGKFNPMMKLSSHKHVFPGRKQIYRLYGKDKMMRRDIVGMDRERKWFEGLLRLRVDRGQIVSPIEDIEVLRKRVDRRIKELPDYLKKLHIEKSYPVQFSKEVKKVFYQTKRNILERQKSSGDIVFFDVDTQNDFMQKRGKLYVKGSEKIIPNIRKLTRLAQRKNIKIFSSADAHPSRHKEFAVFGPHCIKNTSGQQKIRGSMLDRCKVVSYKSLLSSDDAFKIFLEYPQIIFEKNDLDVFTNPNVDKFLKFINKAFVYGVVTEFCVKCAIEGLLARGIEIFLINDAIKEIDRHKAIQLITRWKKRGVKIVNISSVEDFFTPL